MYKNQPYYIKQHGSVPQKRITTMVYYLFPKYSLHFLKYFNISYDPNDCNLISPSLHHYIEEVQCRIQECDRWNVLYNNPYTNINQYSKQNGMSLFYYEILELYTIMHFSWENFYKIHSIHLGNDSIMSLKAMQSIRKNSEQDQSHMISELKDLSYCNTINKTIDVAFCNASGSNEYDNAINLAKYMCFILLVQKRKGACIIRYSDTFSSLSLDVISIVSFFYEKMYFLKPSICDLTNGDKFIVCKNFLYDDLTERYVQVIHSLFHSVYNNKNKIYRVLSCPIPLFILGKLEEINSIFGQPRLEHIHQLLSETEKGELKTNKQKCIEWCVKYLRRNQDSLLHPPFQGEKQ